MVNSAKPYIPNNPMHWHSASGKFSKTELPFSSSIFIICTFKSSGFNCNIANDMSQSVTSTLSWGCWSSIHYRSNSNLNTDHIAMRLIIEFVKTSWDNVLQNVFKYLRNSVGYVKYQLNWEFGTKYIFFSIYLRNTLVHPTLKILILIDI